MDGKVITVITGSLAALFSGAIAFAVFNRIYRGNFPWKTSKTPVPASFAESRFRIEAATENDWPWIVQGQVEIAWARLGPDHQHEVSWQTVEERVAQQVAKLRQEEGFPNEA
ncbi:MAG: hypothetical protein H8E01_00060, partial [Chloroflexi bacterium]|nr:hypothetical protein [Chloroflexota bacterium]